MKPGEILYLTRNEVGQFLSLKEALELTEKSIEEFEAPAHFQLMRTGYFCLDKDSTKDNIILNRSVSLKDGFKK